LRILDNIILGGGISGLSSAYYLKKSGLSNFLILESNSRLGGKINTFLEEGFLIEESADSFVTTKSYALDLIKDLGLEDQIIQPLTNDFFFLGNEGLIPPPKGLVNMVPTNIDLFQEYPFFTQNGKDEVLNERFISPNLNQEDESFGNFITRRFGKEMLEKYAAPLFQGIYATPVDELSLNATFSNLRLMEQKYGSLTAANQELKLKGDRSRSTFAGLRKGIGSLIDALELQIKDNYLLKEKIEAIVVEDEFIRVNTSNTSYYAKSLINTLHPVIFNGLLGVSYPTELSQGSSILLTLGYKSEDVINVPNCSGFIAFDDYDGNISAATFSSKKWENRATNGFDLFRIFVKKETCLNLPEEELTILIINEFNQLFKIEASPCYIRTTNWSNALPQYKIGHLNKIDSWQKSVIHPKIVHIGCAINGVGIPDCIHSGKNAANSIKDLLECA